MNFELRNDGELCNGRAQTELHCNGDFVASWLQIKLPDEDGMAQGILKNILDAAAECGAKQERELLKQRMGIPNSAWTPIEPAPIVYHYESVMTGCANCGLVANEWVQKGYELYQTHFIPGTGAGGVMLLFLRKPIGEV